MSIFGAMNIAYSGLVVDRKWLDAVSDNISNMNNVSPTDERAFVCWRVDLVPGRMIELPGELSGRILLATSGEIGVSQGQDGLVLKHGQAAFLEAGCQAKVSGNGQGFLTATGLDA